MIKKYEKFAQKEKQKIVTLTKFGEKFYASNFITK